MATKTLTADNSGYQNWLDSKKVIKTMLLELRPDMTEEQHDHNAAAILARLASHEPPILTEYAEDV